MKRIWLILAAALLAIGGLAAVWSVIGVSAGKQPAALALQDTPAAPDAPHRQIDGDANAPTISFIDNPAPTCYVENPGTGTCYINWSYLYVAAGSSQYMISMTVSLDDRVRAYTSGFFQTTMYVPGSMFGKGFRVACGVPGDGPSPNLGRTYSYTVRARETGGLGSTNYGSVTCPAGKEPLYLPFVIRP
jgi:hypothetical protein